MATKFSRQVWAYDPNYTRVEALDDAGQPLGYVYFESRTNRGSQPRPDLGPRVLSNFPQVCRQLVLNLCSTAVS